ncbi:MAG: hypothetical protein HY898_06470 [Deltaproteobacteria bacterium]|nr:hypothetical protein [Deltaproteobacteria bacterium]
MFTMATATGLPLSVSLIAAVFLLGACKSPPAASPDPQATASPTASGAPESPVSMVETAVVLGQCPDSATMNTKAARDAIRKLVDPCAGVPGGSAHFAATLMPDGRIELAAPSGDPAEGVVPTCVLKNKLAHKVMLHHGCKFDVKLEERPGTPPASN